MPKGRGAKPRRKPRSHLDHEERVALLEGRVREELLAVKLAAVDVEKFNLVPQSDRVANWEEAKRVATNRLTEAKTRAERFEKRLNRLRKKPLSKRAKTERNKAIKAQVRETLEDHCRRCESALLLGEIEAEDEVEGQDPEIHRLQLKLLEYSIVAAENALDKLK